MSEIPTSGANPSFVVRVAVPTGFIILVVIIWEGYVRLCHVSPLVLPPPSSVWHDFSTHCLSLLGSLWTTLLVTIEAFALVSVLGVGLAIICSRSRLVELAIEPLMVITQVEGSKNPWV